MVTKYGSDPEITALVDKFDWYLMPLANPDGYDYSHDTVRPWPHLSAKPYKNISLCYYLIRSHFSTNVKTDLLTGFVHGLVFFE